MQSFNIMLGADGSEKRVSLAELLGATIDKYLGTAIYDLYRLGSFHPYNGERIMINFISCCSCDSCFNIVCASLKVDALIVFEIGSSTEERYSSCLLDKTKIFPLSCLEEAQMTLNNVILALTKNQKIEETKKIEEIEKTEEIKETKETEKTKEHNLNVLLVTHKSIDNLFLRHLGKGRFSEKEIFGAKHEIFPLTFNTNQGHVNINVIYKDYEANELLDEVDGVIAVPPHKHLINYNKDITDAYIYIERLVDSYTPTFIFKDFDKIWQSKIKKQRFLEPFTFILRETINATIV